MEVDGHLLRGWKAWVQFGSFVEDALAVANLDHVVRRDVDRISQVVSKREVVDLQSFLVRSTADVQDGGEIGASYLGHVRLDGLMGLALVHGVFY